MRQNHRNSYNDIEQKAKMFVIKGLKKKFNKKNLEKPKILKSRTN